MKLPGSEIPLLNTADLWQRYVHDPQTLSASFRDNPEDFLITRLEDIRSILKLPTQPHRRQVNELVLVTKGTLTRSCNLNQLTIGPGHIHLLLANQIATVDTVTDDVSGFYCHFSLETIIRLYHKEHMVKELSQLNAFMQHDSIHLADKALPAVQTLFERLVEEYRTNNDLSLIDAYLVTLCYEIRNAIQPETGSRTAPGMPFELTEQFKRLVLQYCSLHPPMTFYADHLGVSPNHLNKSVKQATGKPATALINDVLLLEAKVLLKHTNYTIGEIAHRLGFDDPSYFGRFFKKVSGQTPLEFRRVD
ncbi:helix-turn-helix transcriptional regulator [Larkinella sp. VNQ87]|uniref:helix-turn-helix transcriptional regulator n=1 Tax=Larkinella sp. VNQ87 TaxID=3400921 RepID=UPI003C0D3F7B